MKTLLLLNLPFGRPVQRDYLCPHGAKASYAWPPIDLLLFGASARKVRRLVWLDAIAERMSRGEALEAVRRTGADEVFTILSSITLESDRAFLAEVRRLLPRARIWASGDIVSFGSGWQGAVDFAVRDLTNAEEIVAGLESGGTAGIVRERRMPEWSVGTCPHDLIRRRRYALPYSLHAGITSVLTNYGCPFACTYCNSNALPFTRRVLDEVVEELVQIERLGIREILFRDFTLGASDVGALCAEIRRHGVRLRWSCWNTASLAEPGLLAEMRAAGCYLVAYGLESGSDRILAEMRRPADTAALRRAVRESHAAGLEVLLSVVIGYPGEDRAETSALLRELDPEYLSLNILATRLGSALASHREGPAEGGAADSLLSPSPALVAARDAMERRFFLRPSRLLRYVSLAWKGPYRAVAFGRSAVSLAARWLRGTAFPP